MLSRNFCQKSVKENFWHFHNVFTVYTYVCGNLSVTHILREINFGESRRCKMAIFALLRALVFVILAHFSVQKVQQFIKIKIQSHYIMAYFETLHQTTLISRKIWVTDKFCNFHTVKSHSFLRQINCGHSRLISRKIRLAEKFHTVQR